MFFSARACRVLPNNTVVCEEHVYSEFDSWKQEKNNLDNMIQQYRQRLDKLKVGTGFITHAPLFWGVWIIIVNHPRFADK